MALRCICSRFPSKLRVPNNKHGFVRSSSSSAAEPSVPWLESPSVVFSVDALNHDWGAWPVVLISAIGLACEILAILRLAIKRDDVWYTKDSAACEFVETRKGYPAAVRKMVVYNQKYETPQQLIEAFQKDVDGPSADIQEIKNDIDVKSNVVNKKIIAAHAIASLGVIYLALFL
ncbi:uncharacterized protein LOC117791868 [Drosophila innubila]|uniref:uncharacterized protein LOC117791868 n=1 Tax=Drosophila innubila TaxID=198719 RepID=UPI00148CEF97|nr:uncharacterized protein LOC117791868 [Drosophila innubila]